jgi:flagellin-like protein
MLQRDTPNDRAVSPVIGVVVMVAITVLLVGTAGAFFFGFSDQSVESSQPTAVFEFEADIASGSDAVTVKHTSGESIDTDNLYVDVEGAQCSAGGSPDGRYSVADDFSIGASEMRAGMTVQVGTDLDFDGTRDLCTGGGDLDLSDATVTVVWENRDGSNGTYSSWTQ